MTRRLATILVIGFATILASTAIHAQNADPLQAANQILEATGVQGGLILHLGSGDGQLTAALRVADSYQVQGLDRDAELPQHERAHVGALLDALAHRHALAVARRVARAQEDRRVAALRRLHRRHHLARLPRRDARVVGARRHQRGRELRPLHHAVVRRVGDERAELALVLHRAELRHTADVVATEVHEHAMLRELFLVRTQIVRELTFLLRAPAPWARTGDRPHGDDPVLDAHEHLR